MENNITVKIELIPWLYNNTEEKDLISYTVTAGRHPKENALYVPFREER